MKNKHISVGAAAIAAGLSFLSLASPVLQDGLHGVWISVPSAGVYRGPVDSGTRAADGTSWFVRRFRNEGEIRSAKWTVAGLGVFEVFVNGKRIGEDFLKPGFTHNKKTKYSFSYDVTEFLKCGADEENVLAAEVSAGWWRDKIVTPKHKSRNRGFAGDKSAFLGELAIEYANGKTSILATDADNWLCGTAGAVKHAAIFDGEEYDARERDPFWGEGLVEKPEVNNEFCGEILPSAGAEVVLRRDLAMSRGPFSLDKGETLVVDFGQNCAAVPEFRFRAQRGTVLTALPGEMLNDADKGVRGCDGPAGSVYRANFRIPKDGMRIAYTFSGEGMEEYMPRFTFFGYRYLSITATDAVEIESVTSVPVSSVKKELETGTLETGNDSVNRLVKNIYWGQLSNYLSVPTDCPQRNERLGWAADTQVFCEAGSFNADTRKFFRKWMRDMRDSQDAKGGFPGVAPFAQYGNIMMRVGWADAGVIVPWTVWRHFGDTDIITDNWAAMERFMNRVGTTRYRTGELPECGNYQWNDWLSLTRLESCPVKPEYGAFFKAANGRRMPKPETIVYWNYMGGCYWLMDAMMMAEMADATHRADDAAKYRKMSGESRAYLKETFFNAGDGMLVETFDGMQTPMLFALKLGLVEGEAKERTIDALKKSIAENGGTLHTGFLGTAVALDVLSENGMETLACDLLLNRNFPGWLYSVDQGATTIWERWNSWTKADGFGPVGMNSFNHYAYGSILAWMYRTLAGIAPEVSEPGFKRVIMAPKPDRRLGHVRAEYKSVAGLIKSAWRYEGDEWIWEFAIPEGATALVAIPGDTEPQEYTAGAYTVKRHLPAAGNPFSAITSPGTAGSPMTTELKLSKLKRGSF